MDQNLDNKIDFKNRVATFLNKNKKKFVSIIIIIILLIISIILLENYKENENSKISEKYVQAGLLLSTDKEKSKELFEQIIYSKNNFYSILALNTILEKNLEKDKKKILEYFDYIEKLSTSKDQKDLIVFKKGLYLIQIFNIEEGNKLFKKLIDSESKLKNIAEELLMK